MSLHPTRALLAQDSIPLSSTLSSAIGRSAALLLQQLHYWLGKSKHVYDGFSWVYNTLPQWAEQLGYSVGTIKRVFARLQQLGIVRIEKRRSHEWNQTNWYAIDYERLKPLLLSNGSFCADRSDHFEPIDQTILSHSFTETTNKDFQTTNTPTHPPVVVGEISDPSEPKEHEKTFQGSATRSKGEESLNAAIDPLKDHSSAAAASPEILAEVREAIAPAPLHPRLAEEVLSYSVEAIREAIAVVRSQKEQATAKNPPGLLRSALKGQWSSADTPKTAMNGFGEWFDSARSAGLVVAGQLLDGVQHVLRATADGDLLLEEWEPLRAAYPLDRLRRICNGLE